MFSEHLDFHENRANDIIFLLETPPENILGADVSTLLTMKMAALALTMRSMRLISPAKITEILKAFRSVEITQDKSQQAKYFNAATRS